MSQIRAPASSVKTEENALFYRRTPTAVDVQRDLLEVDVKRRSSVCICRFDERRERSIRLFSANHICVTNPNTCQNAGTCVPNGQDYICSCPAGWTGRNCETAESERTAVLNVRVDRSSFQHKRLAHRIHAERTDNVSKALPKAWDPSPCVSATPVGPVDSATSL